MTIQWRQVGVGGTYIKYIFKPTVGLIAILSRRTFCGLVLLWKEALCPYGVLAAKGI